MSDSSLSASEHEQDVRSKKPKKLIDYQRMELEKLMSDPTKEVDIPQLKQVGRKPKAFEPHEFVRNVMGASAGAGSGEFDIYRGCRRRQMLREEFTNEQHKKQADKQEFEKKLKENLKEANERTAKKRAKRLKKKEKFNKKKQNNQQDVKNLTEQDTKVDTEEEKEEDEDVIDLNELDE